MARSRLILLSVFVAASLALAIGSGASSAGRPARATAAAPLLLRFEYANLPAVTTQVTLDGVQEISTLSGGAQNTAGSIRAFVKYQTGFAITPASFGPLNARIEAQVQPTAGVSVINGTANPPAGAQLTLQVNGGAAVPIAGKFTIPLPTLAQPAVAGPCDAASPGAMIGTDGNDVLTGTQGADTIIAKAGSDRIQGKGGHDRICAGPGNDAVTAGSGHDEVLAGAGNDLIRGGPGHDYLNLGPGTDRGYGGTGHDTLVGDRGNDTLDGGPGIDQVNPQPTKSGR